MLLRRETRASRAAFTLMEMMIVVAIIVVLAGVGGVIYTRMLDDAKLTTARTQARVIAEAAEMYQITHGEYPASLDVLTQPVDGGKPYLEPEALSDPWRRPYQYAVPGPHHATTGKPDVWSQGPNGDGATQIGNW